MCSAVRSALQDSNIAADRVKALSFDATCSLVVIGDNFAPISVSPHHEPEQNIIVWLDHRAIEQADRINTTDHWCLQTVGGKVSPEMQIPKLLWLSEHMPQVIDQAHHFLDLADFLSFRATDTVNAIVYVLLCFAVYSPMTYTGGSLHVHHGVQMELPAACGCRNGSTKGRSGGGATRDTRPFARLPRRLLGNDWPGRIRHQWRPEEQNRWSSPCSWHTHR